MRKKKPPAKPSKPRRKVCSRCGSNYFRRNLLVGWTQQNPGKRLGWQREELRICLACMPQKTTQQFIGVIATGKLL